VNDGFRVSGTGKPPNWTSIGNDRFGELDGKFWLTMSDRNRCQPDVGCPLNSAPLVNFQKSLASRGWVGVATDFWAFDSMRPPPQPIFCHPQAPQASQANRNNQRLPRHTSRVISVYKAFGPLAKVDTGQQAIKQIVV
jgi:hypothetical protein